MASLEELKKKHEIKSEDSPASGPRAKLLYQADRMLAELGKYKTEQELDGPNTQYWWAPKSVNGKRRVSARYGGKVVEGLAMYSDNTLDGVRAVVKKFKALIEDSDDDTWADEEARRQKK
tara:strand:+ start:48 stop:407 length:360 start_codon:yes stop_codon:yes gene_type:complete